VQVVGPFFQSWELFGWPWCNLTASQRRPYCSSVNSHSSVGLVNQQWDTIDWTCRMCDRCIQSERVIRSASSQQCTCPCYSCLMGLFGKASHHQCLSAPLHPRFGSLWLLAFPTTKFALEREEICECDGHTVHRLSQWHLPAEWLAPR